jgi:hypothetical protein
MRINTVEMVSVDGKWNELACCCVQWRALVLAVLNRL